jgi:hypothetical protein
MKRLLGLVILALCVATGAAGQPFLSSRAIALGAYDAAVKDVRGFLANPAGLVQMKDWDIHTTTYIATAQSGAGFVFSGFDMGKKLFENDALGFQYSPGVLQEFVLPSAERINGQNIAAERMISYAEPLGIGVAHRFSQAFSAGIGIRMRTATVNDPQFQLQVQDSTIVPIPNESRVTTWFGDASILWMPLEKLTIAAVGRGLVHANSGSFPPEFEPYQLDNTQALELGVAYHLLEHLTISGEGSTEKKGALGIEWVPGLNIAARGGLYVDRTAKHGLNAFGIGVGWSFEFLDVDAAYLGFFERANRSGSASSEAFDPSRLTDISMNPFTTDRVTLSVKACFGRVRENLIRIEFVEMLGGVYPSAYETFAYRPLGKVRLKNISPKPVHAKASFFVEKYMDAPTETPAVHVAPGEVVELPLTAVFNDLVKSVRKVTVSDGDVRVSAVTTEEYDDRAQTRLLIHGRNDWDGDVLTLRYFVTPDDPEIIRYSRDILLSMRDSLAACPRELETFQKAKLLFSAFAGKLMYVNDPKLTADYVQYPSETLSLRGGDCDDMTVCFVSLLSSIGISTAFVDVIPPDHPENAHIYMLFDTGLEPKYGKSLSDNPKRYIVRATKSGKETLWIAIETTAITQGFAEAWAKGAQEHFEHAKVDLGLIKGWVRIVDVN